MKIKLLRSPGKVFPDLQEGQTVDLSDELAEHLVKVNLAERVTIEAVPAVADIQGVPPEEGSVEKAEEDLKNYRDRAKKKAHGE